MTVFNAEDEEWLEGEPDRVVRYVTSWIEHINDLQRLKWHVDPDDGTLEEIDQIQERLMKIVRHNAMTQIAVIAREVSE